MKYAVIKTGGKQYKVSEGKELKIEKLPLEKKDKVEFNEVLLVVDDGTVKIGQPFLTDVKVEGEVLDQIKGEKIRVSKFKAKTRYRKVKGHRQKLTKIKIKRIVFSKEKK